jgi:hypothetical protein
VPRICHEVEAVAIVVISSPGPAEARLKPDTTYETEIGKRVEDIEGSGGTQDLAGTSEGVPNASGDAGDGGHQQGKSARRG